MLREDELLATGLDLRIVETSALQHTNFSEIYDWIEAHLPNPAQSVGTARSGNG